MAKTTQPITDVLAMLDAGKFDRFAGRELQALIDTISEGMEEGGTSKGSITIKIDVKVAGNGVIRIQPSLACKEPPTPQTEQMLWTNKSGVLVAENPKQQDLPFRPVVVTTTEGGVG